MGAGRKIRSMCNLLNSMLICNLYASCLISLYFYKRNNVMVPTNNYRFIMKHIFILYLFGFGVIDINVISYKFSKVKLV